MAIYGKSSGAWTKGNSLKVMSGGVWANAKEGWAKSGGEWKKFYPDSGEQWLTTPGNHDLAVPAGVTTIYVSICAAGGGSGACNNYGDVWVGGGGGAGGIYYDQIIAVTPGEILTFVVGKRGFGASYNFNGNVIYNKDDANNIIGFGSGTNGGESAVWRGGTKLVSASGGAGGIQYGYGAGGDPEYPNTNHGDGELGSGPNNPRSYGYNGPIKGGTNGTGTPPDNNSVGTGWGNGGGQSGWGVGVNGQDGVIYIHW